MDFLEFLKSGNADAVRRVVFDGKVFKFENNSASDPYFELDGSSVRERNGGYTGYTLKYWQNKIVSSNPYFNIFKDGSLTDYSIELNGDYAELKKSDSRVNSYDNLNNVAEQDNNEPAKKTDDTSLGIKVLVNVIYAMLISFVPPLIFFRIMANTQIAKKSQRFSSTLTFFSIVVGLILFGGQIIMMYTYTDMGFISKFGGVGMTGIYFTYLICHILNLIMFFIPKLLAKVFKTKRAINIATIIYTVVFVAILVTFVSLFLAAK